MEKVVRLNTEKKINHDSFRVKIGTTNKNDPRVLYVEGRTFITPTEESEDYGTSISRIKHNFTCSIREQIRKSNLFDDRFIVDFQIAKNGISLNKKSFLSFQFLVRQKGEDPLKVNDVKVKVEPYIIGIVDSLDSSLSKYGFCVSKCKTAD